MSSSSRFVRRLWVGCAALTLVSCGQGDGGDGPDASTGLDAAVGPAVLRVDPDHVDFGTVVVGASSAGMAFTVTNDGFSPSGAIAVAVDGGDNPGDFRLVSTTCAAPLAPAESCTVTVDFTPLREGDKNATVTVGLAGGGGTAVTLTGEAILPGRLEIASLGNDLGAVEVGHDSDELQVFVQPGVFTVTNTGQADTEALTITEGGDDPDDFELVGLDDECTGVTLAPGDTCLFRVRFAPTATGDRFASYAVGNGADDVVTGTVRGLGFQVLAVTADTSADFGDVALAVTATRSFTIQNVSDHAVASVATTLTDETVYAITTSDCDAALAPGASCHVTVAFTPDALGAATDALHVTGQGGGDQTVDLTGNGVAPHGSVPTAITLTPSSLAENAAVGTTVGVLGAVDADATDTFAFSLVAGSGADFNDSFAIEGDVVRALASFDAEATPTVSIRVSVLDSGGQSFAQALAIEISNVDEPPVAVADAASVVEDGGAQAVDVLGNDTDVDGGPKQVATTTQGAHGAVVITGGGSGLTYRPQLDFCGSDSFGYTLNGGSSTTVTVTVACVDDAPSFVAGPSLTGVPNSVGGVANAVTVSPWASALSAGPANEAGQALSFELTANSNPSLFTAGPAVSPTGALTFTTNRAASGTATITLRIKDDGGTANGGVDVSATQAFTIQTVPGETAPVAVDDAYAATGNVAINVSAVAEGVLQRGTDDSGGGLTVSAFGATTSLGTVANGSNTITTSHGATVLMRTDGTFTYDPAAGFKGTDTFAYRAHNTVGDATGTVTITVANMAWFFDASVAGPGTGRRTDPFKAFGSLDNSGNGLAKPGDVLFFDSGTYVVGFDMAVQDGQVVLGRGASEDVGAFVPGGLAPFSVAMPPVGGTAPVLSGTIFNALPTLTLDGFTLDGTSSSVAALGAFNFGTLTVKDVTVNSLSGVRAISMQAGTVNGSFLAVNGDGADRNVSFLNVNSTTGVDLGGGALTNAINTAVFVQGGTGAFRYGGTITFAGAGDCIRVFNRTGGSLTLSGDVNCAGVGFAVRVQNNTGGRVELSGSSVVVQGSNSGSAIGFVNNTGSSSLVLSGGGLDVRWSGFGAALVFSSAGGSVEITGAHNKVSATGNGAALSMSGGVAIGSGGLTFESLSTASNGISLLNTGTLGGLTVTGSGTSTARGGDGSGGRISNSSGNGFQLTGTGPVRLQNMLIENVFENAVKAQNVPGLTIDRVTFQGTQGNSVFTHAGPVRLIDVTGTVTINNSIFGNAAINNVALTQTTGTVDDLVISNNQLGSTKTDSTADNVFVELPGTGSATVHVTSNAFSPSGGHAISGKLQGSGTLKAAIRGNTFDLGSAATGASDVTLQAPTGAQGTLQYDISGNLLTGGHAGVISVLTSAGTTTALSGRIDTNVVGVAGQNRSGCNGTNAILLQHAGNGAWVTGIAGNVVRQCTGTGIGLVTVGGGTGSLDATVTTNLLTELPVGGSGVGLSLDASNAAGSTAACLDARNNDVGTYSTSTDIQLNQGNATTVVLPGYSGLFNSTAAVSAFVAGQNAATPAVVTTLVNAPPGGGYTGALAACATPITLP